MITNIYLPGCRRIGIQGGRLRRPRRRAVVGSIWAGGIGIGACQELDPIADRGPAVFGIPCSRRSDSVPWREGRAGRRCTCPESRSAVGGRWVAGVTSAVSTWPAMGCMPVSRSSGRRTSTDRHTPVAIHHRRHHHRESAEYPCNTRQRTCVSTGRTYECVGGGRKVG